MNQLDKIQTPEEKELHEKIFELGNLEGILSQKELDLATLDSELSAFNIRYLRIVGVKFAELDKINSQIAEFLANLNPEDIQAQEEAQAAQTQADESYTAADLGQEDIKAEKFKPTKDLRDIYRKLAKLVHPDLADDEEERKRRNGIMAEVNKAYREGSIEKLEEILENWQSSPEQIKGEDIGAKLVRAIRMISRVKNRLAAIEKEISQLVESNTHQLMQRVNEAKQEGIDLLNQMVNDLDKQIEQAKAELEKLKAEYEKSG